MRFGLIGLTMFVGITNSFHHYSSTTRRLQSKFATVPREQDLPQTSDVLPKSNNFVRAIENDEDFLEAMRESQGGRLVIVKFFASWCKACKSIQPRYKRLANEFHDVASFYEVEFSANKDLCRRLDVKKLPCVQLFRGEDGYLDTVLCGPSKFPDVRTRIEVLLGMQTELPAAVPTPEFTDVSQHYDQPNFTSVQMQEQHP